MPSLTEAEAAFVARMTAGMSEEQRILFELNLKVEQLVEELNAANANGSSLRCRELSLAITNIEQGGHWLTDRIADLDPEQ
jgi:hypothetical protein